MSINTNPTQSQLEFIELLIRAYLDDCLNTSNTEFMEEFKKSLKKLDDLFLAKVAIYLRHNYYIKGIPNYMGAYLSLRTSGKKWGKDFYRKLVVHIDDMIEMGNILDLEDRRLTKNMKTGFKMAFKDIDSVQILKYRNRKGGMSLQDIIRLVHPKASGTNALGIDLVMNNAVQLDSISDFDLGNEELFRIIEEIEFS